MALLEMALIPHGSQIDRASCRHQRPCTKIRCWALSEPNSMLCELLFDEKSAQMRQLPGAGYAEHSQLNQGPAHNARISRL